MMATERELRIRVKGREYLVERLGPSGGVFDAVRLHVADGNDAYDVVMHPDGVVSCTCGDYEWRRRDRVATPCKHGRAAVEGGLLADPAPAETPRQRAEAELQHQREGRRR